MSRNKNTNGWYITEIAPLFFDPFCFFYPARSADGFSWANYSHLRLFLDTKLLSCLFSSNAGLTSLPLAPFELGEYCLYRWPPLSLLHFPQNLTALCPPISYILLLSVSWKEVNERPEVNCRQCCVYRFAWPNG